MIIEITVLINICTINMSGQVQIVISVKVLNRFKFTMLGGYMNTQILNLHDRCRFHLGDVPDAWQAWFDDSDWDEVNLPHDWSVSQPFSREYSSGTGYLAGGIGWYRIHITPKEEWRGKRIVLAFDGVYKNSRVWCNSYYLGHRPNG